MIAGGDAQGAAGYGEGIFAAYQLLAVHCDDRVRPGTAGDNVILFPGLEAVVQVVVDFGVASSESALNVRARESCHEAVFQRRRVTHLPRQVVAALFAHHQIELDPGDIHKPGAHPDLGVAGGLVVKSERSAVDVEARLVAAAGPIQKLHRGLKVIKKLDESTLLERQAGRMEQMRAAKDIVDSPRLLELFLVIGEGA